MSWEQWRDTSPLFSVRPSRRDFLKVSGAGLILAFSAGPLGNRLAAAQDHGPPPFAKDFNAYLHIKPDGRVTCLVGKVEIGQGSKTAFAQLIADELDVSFDSVDMVMGDTDLCPWDMGTFGSLSMRMYGPVVRGAVAEARAVLLQMASEKLQVPVEKLQVKDGVVSVTGVRGKSISYAKLVDGKRIERHLEKVPFKKPSALKVMGTSQPRRDAFEKVTGQAKYAADFNFPGMVFARILRPPAHGAKLKSLDSSGLAKIAGAQLVRDGDLIAVLHEKPDLAAKALEQLKAEFELPPPGLNDVSIFEHVLKFTPQLKVAKENGSLEEGAKLVTAALGSQAGITEETYTTAYGYHATMETNTAVAKIDDGKVTVWASTQVPFTTKKDVAQALGLPPEKVRVIVPYVGGGFGGKSERTQVSVEAARLAKLSGKPVKLVWTRAEDIFYCKFRPVGVMKIRSGVNSAGRVSLWDYKVYGAGDWGSISRYDFPHQKVSWVGHWLPDLPSPKEMHPFAVGPWRMPSVNSNVFAVESQMDMLASKAGIDPLEFRLNHLTDPRMRRVLETVARQFGWKAAKGPSGRGVGVACGACYDGYFGHHGTYVATMAEVAVDKNTGRVQVKRVATAVDAGLIVNPLGARQQVEGCITMGLGYTLSEELRFRDGEILNRNFDTYEIPHFSWLPKMDITFVDNPDLNPEGIGEPPIITMGAVIANAIYDAVGARLRHLPMTPARVQEAMKQV
jgi:nicotinate dehydrogenase subunit B